MHDTVDRVALAEAKQEPAVADVALLDHNALALVEVEHGVEHVRADGAVEDDDVLSGAEEIADDVGAEEARASGDENTRHRAHPGPKTGNGNSINLDGTSTWRPE